MSYDLFEHYVIALLTQVYEEHDLNFGLFSSENITKFLVYCINCNPSMVDNLEKVLLFLYV